MTERLPNTPSDSITKISTTPHGHAPHGHAQHEPARLDRAALDRAPLDHAPLDDALPGAAPRETQLPAESGSVGGRRPPPAGESHAPAPRRSADRGGTAAIAGLAGPSPAASAPAASARNRAAPGPVLENLALSAIEVIAGARDLEQLGRWVTREVYEHLAIHATIASRARRVRGAAEKRPVILGTRVSAFPTSEGVVDGVVTVTMRDRTRAVAIRIEWVGGRWRASAIHVL